MSLPFGPFPLETAMLGVTHGSLVWHPYLLRRSRVPQLQQDQARRGAAWTRRLHRGQGIARRWSPWGGEERREPVGQVVECLFLSPISFGQAKEIGS